MTDVRGQLAELLPDDGVVLLDHVDRLEVDGGDARVVDLGADLAFRVRKRDPARRHHDLIVASQLEAGVGR